MYEAIKAHAKPFDTVDDLNPLIEEIGDATIVLLGESSHGTSEYYSIRAELSKKLIEEKGFDFIAVEGDWPACSEVNSYIKSYMEKESAFQVLEGYKRWPTWMWANEEIADLVEWLKDYNQKNKSNIGFYGIDVYSLYESIDEIIHYLRETEPKGADLELAKKAFTCFEPYNRQEQQYAIASAFYSGDCVDHVAKLLASIRTNEKQYHSKNEQDLNLRMNALAAFDAENYYRTMVRSDAESWNVRDRHMVKALNEIRNYYGKDSKVIVWEHNTHVGDASATDMKEEGMINVGQLVREENNPEDVYVIGFGTNQGTVVAADEWGVNLERMVVPKAQSGSWENLMHQAGAYNQYISFKNNREMFQHRIGHRAIGVVYNPAYESYGNYVPSIMGNRYDAFIYVDKTTALHPITTAEVLL